jgi:hypothetical protein
MLRVSLMVGVLISQISCHQGLCSPGGFVVEMVQGAAESSVYAIEFRARFDEVSIIHRVTCENENENEKPTCVGDEIQYDPDIAIPNLIIDYIEPYVSGRTFAVLNFRLWGCSDEVCDIGPSYVEIRLSKDGEFQREIALAPVYTRFCKGELGEYRSTSIELVLE